MKSKDIKFGAVFSYILIFANTLYGLFFTPFLVSALGEGEYGVYKIIGSLVSSIEILDLGIGGTMLRFVAKFNAEDDKRNLENFSAMGLVEAGILSAIMSVVCCGIFFSIDGLYGDSLTSAELAKAKHLFVLFTVILVLNIFEKVIYNVVAGCEHFALANGLKVIRIGSKALLGYLIISNIPNSVYLMWIDIFIVATIIVIQLVYIRIRICRIRLHKWDTTLFKSSGKYTILMFLQSLAIQMNGNIDNMVIGAVEGAAAVTVYSIGLQLYNMYEHFAMAFSDLMLPTVSKQIANGASNCELEDTVIKVGRLEFIALGGALVAYIVIGQEFIHLWMGDGFEFAWVVGLILMVPTTIPLIQNVSISILRAKNRMAFRTVAVFCMAILNLFITVIGVKLYGAVAACFGTALGIVVANIIAMNIYYYRVIHLNVFRIFKGILSRTWICCLLSAAALVAVNNLLQGGWKIWMIKAIIFCLLYGFLLLLFGFNKYEKKSLLGIFLKRRKINEN